MLGIVKPKNARSKRALEKRESKELESAKTAIFVKGNRTSDKVNMALVELAALKKPDTIPFNKHNDVLPFEDASSLEFWGQKNDASLFVVGSSQKKRPHNLVWVRLFDGQVLDMLEMGITDAKSMREFKTNKPGIGMRPLFHFSGPEFAAESLGDDRLAAAGAGQEPSGAYLHLKSLILDFYRGEELNPNQIALGGLEHVISVSIAPSTNAAKPAQSDELTDLYRAAGIPQHIHGGSAVQNCPPCTVLFRVYTVRMIASGTKTPRIELDLCGPSFDFELRRRVPASVDAMTKALKRPKTAEQKNTQGKGKRKNVDTDEMGDMVGQIHVGKQDLSKLNAKKIKALRTRRFVEEDDNPAFDDEDGGDDDDDDDEDEDDDE
ncbi:rRNA-binding ribosome biosynthesis protein rpf2 [Malassezia cuniculi]|uniref:Ribosome production factor 2 homolog n=1 Tax=Malassezia cuniculi TaxID=948313 RepID=A0AAF0EU80_9BASI|nr:rRNA-binding ribosome biosynthesis protein rpf2 [Malassezia cuniculi]